MLTAKSIIIAAVGLAVICAGLVCTAYLRDIRTIRARVADASRIAQTRHGAIEFVRWGDGPSVLLVHGAGGGYDQGRLLGNTFGGDGHDWIAVSRFGYLRATLPDIATTEAQAQAFADLLDQLGIERTAILAMSGGVPPALQFARLYPERTTALVLLSSAPFTPLTAGQQDLPIPAWLYQTLFGSDFAFWAILKLSPTALDRIFDVSPERRAAMNQADRDFVSGLTNAFLPVTGRVAGLRNEAAAVDPSARYDLDAIAAPVLVVHARDDGINPFAFGEYAADHIANAEFLPLPSGGHLLLGHVETVRQRVATFLAFHSNTKP